MVPPRIILASGFWLLASLLSATPALAVIEVKQTITDLRDLSRAVVIATVTKSDGKTVEARLDETIKPDPKLKIPDTFRIVPAAALPLDIKVGDRAVILLAKTPGTAVIHLADTWILAAYPPDNLIGFNLRAAQPALRATFPGRTAALVAVFQEMESHQGKSTLLNALGDRTLNTDPRELAKLPVKNPTSFSAADVNADGRPDLLICADHKPHLFLATANGYEDQTEKWGLKDAKGDVATLIPGATHAGNATVPATAPAELLWLLIGPNAYIKEGGQFIDANSQKGKLGGWYADVAHTTGSINNSEILATTAGPFGDDGQTYVIAAAKNSLMRIRASDFASMAHKDKPDFAIDDDTRLTGAPINQYHPDHKTNGFKNPALVPLDANGDGRPDLLLIADGGNLLLLNRGFGAFLVDPDAAATLKHKGLYAAAKLDPKSKQDSLLILTPDGTLYAIDTAPPKRP